MQSKGGVSSRVVVKLDLVDRVRVLFGAKLMVFVETSVDRDPGRVVRSWSEVQVGALRSFGVERDQMSTVSRTS